MNRHRTQRSQRRGWKLGLAQGATFACLVLGVGAATASGTQTDDPVETPVAATGEQARRLHIASSDVSNRQLDGIESTAAKARRGARLEIEQAREQSKDFPVAAREKLTSAIERSERARAEVGERLNELQRANKPDWEARQRVIDALQELANARHDVVAVFAGGEPALPQGG